MEDGKRVAGGEVEEEAKMARIEKELENWVLLPSAVNGGKLCRICVGTKGLETVEEVIGVTGKDEADITAGLVTETD